MQKLAYGAAWLVPDDAKAAWGARLIVHQDGYVDLVPDRQDAVGEFVPKGKLLQHLNGLGDDSPIRRVSAMLKAGQIKVSGAEEVTVHQDDRITVRGSCNSSYGYFYIAAWPNS